MPYFSVTIPVYNVEKYLRQCIESVLGQSFQDFEIIIVDDGSTDSSGSICDEYAQKYNNIHVIHKSNEGLLLARRTALQNVSGNVVLFLDSDDYWEKELLKSVYDVFQKCSCDMVVYRYSCIDEQGNYLYTQKKLLPNMKIVENAGSFLLRQLGITYEYNAMWLKAVKREYIDIEADYTKYKGLSMGEDIFQTVPIAKKIDKFVYLDKVLYCYRIIQQSMTRNVTEKHLVDYMNVRRYVIDSIKENKSYDNKTIALINEYTLRGFFGFLADYSQNNKHKEEWKKSQKIIKQVYKNYMINTNGCTWKFCCYLGFLKSNRYFLYKILGKIKQLILSLYNMSLSER